MFLDDVSIVKEKNSENTSIDRASCATAEKALLDNELNMADFVGNNLESENDPLECNESSGSEILDPANSEASGEELSFI